MELMAMRPPKRSRRAGLELREAAERQRSVALRSRWAAPVEPPAAWVE
jgi:hypothetical protein